MLYQTSTYGRKVAVARVVCPRWLHPAKHAETMIWSHHRSRKNLSNPWHRAVWSNDWSRKDVIIQQGNSGPATTTQSLIALTALFVVLRILFIVDGWDVEKTPRWNHGKSFRLRKVQSLKRVSHERLVLISRFDFDNQSRRDFVMSFLMETCF